MELIESGLIILDYVAEYGVGIAVLFFVARFVNIVAPQLLHMPRNIDSGQKAVYMVFGVIALVALPTVIGYVIISMVTAVSGAVTESLPAIEQLGSDVSEIVVPDLDEFNAAWNGEEIQIESTPIIIDATVPDSAATPNPTITPTAVPHDPTTFDPNSGNLPPTPEIEGGQ